jgi:hypothetical protein
MPYVLTLKRSSNAYVILNALCRTLVGIELRQLPGEAPEYVLLMLDPGLPAAELQQALR